MQEGGDRITVSICRRRRRRRKVPLTHRTNCSACPYGFAAVQFSSTPLIQLEEKEEEEEEEEGENVGLG